MNTQPVVQAHYLHMTAQTEQINNTQEISLFFLDHVTCVDTQEGTSGSSTYTTEYSYYNCRI